MSSSQPSAFTKFFQEAKKLKFWTIATLYVEVILMFHQHNNFSSLEYALRENGFYEGKNEEEKLSIYSWLLAMIIVAMFSLAILNGFIIDTIGTWYSRVLAQILLITGISTALMITKENSYLIWIAYPLFYGGGYMATEAGLLTYVLYPKQMGMLSSLTGVSVGGSALWYLFYKKICTPFENTRIWWWIMMSFQPLVTLRTFFLMPKLKVTKNGTDRVGWQTRHDTYANFKDKETEKQIYKIQKHDPENKAEIEKLTSQLNNQVTEKSETTQQKSAPSTTFLKELFKAQNFLFFCWWFISDIRQLSYMSKYQSWLRTKTQDAEEVSSFTEIYSKCMMVQMITEPCCGRFLDFIRATFQAKIFKKGDANETFTKSMVLTTCIGFILTSISTSLTSFFQARSPFSIVNIIGAGVATVTTDSFRWSCKFMFLFTTVNPEFTPRVLAFSNIFIILANLVVPQLNYVLKIFDNDWDQFNMALGFLSLSSMLFPILILYIYFGKNLVRKDAEVAAVKQEEEKQVLKNSE